MIRCLLFFLFLQGTSLCLSAQVDPDDDLIPSQGGQNDSPARHALFTPLSKNRGIQKNGQSMSKVTLKRINDLEKEKHSSLDSLNRWALQQPTGKIITCNQCYGKGIIACATCFGNGFNECLICHGLETSCKRCSGKGMIFDQTCSSCSGTGIGVCTTCSGKKDLCRNCQGVGYLNCDLCHGGGKGFLLPASHQDSLDHVRYPARIEAVRKN